MSRNELKDVEAALAHDLNNYLQVVMGNLEVLRRRASFVPEIVAAALNATRHAAQLADRMVAIGRLRNPEPRALDVGQALGEMRDMVTRTVGDAIHVEMTLAAGLGAHIDPRCLQIALLELAANARDAMPNGGRLDVRAARADGPFIKVEVADTGPGMQPERIAHAFEPFAARGEAGNLGLGLHIVERCLHAAGGRVEIASPPSNGAIVTLYIPIA